VSAPLFWGVEDATEVLNDERFAMKYKSILTGAGLAAAVCCFALASSSDETTTGVDPEQFQDFMSYQVDDIFVLEQFFTDGQYFFLPITPPPEDFILRQTGLPEVFPFQWEKFPESFIKGDLPPDSGPVSMRVVAGC
jgi:hypothetical protein